MFRDIVITKSTKMKKTNACLFLQTKISSNSFISIKMAFDVFELNFSNGPILSKLFNKFYLKIGGVKPLLTDKVARTSTPCLLKITPSTMKDRTNCRLHKL